jgi:hypothetical protein
LAPWFQKAEANLYDSKVITQDKDSAVLLGIQKRSHQFWPVQVAVLKIYILNIFCRWPN